LFHNNGIIMGQSMSEQFVHPVILDGIANLERRSSREIQVLTIEPMVNMIDTRIDRASVSHLVSFMRQRVLLHCPVTELKLSRLHLKNPSDGSLDVLREFFAEDTALSKIEIVSCCGFRDAEATSRLFAAIQTNTSLTDLTMYAVYRRGAALGGCLFGLFHMRTLQRLVVCDQSLDAEAIRAFQLGLRENRHMKELRLSQCRINDEGLRLIVDALVGNTTLEVLDIAGNDITSNSLSGITRLVKVARLKEIYLSDNPMFVNSSDTTRTRLQFVRALSRNKSLRTLDVTTERCQSFWLDIIFFLLQPTRHLNICVLGCWKPLFIVFQSTVIPRQ
jgi:Leucine Rich repeat